MTTGSDTQQRVQQASATSNEGATDDGGAAKRTMRVTASATDECDLGQRGGRQTMTGVTHNSQMQQATGNRGATRLTLSGGDRRRGRSVQQTSGRTGNGGDRRRASATDRATSRHPRGRQGRRWGADRRVRQAMGGDR